jgi:hypothetical protein
VPDHTRPAGLSILVDFPTGADISSPLRLLSRWATDPTLSA